MDVGVLRLIGSLLPEEGIDEMGLGCCIAIGGFDGGVKSMVLTLFVCCLFESSVLSVGVGEGEGEVVRGVV